MQGETLSGLNQTGEGFLLAFADHIFKYNSVVGNALLIRCRGTIVSGVSGALALSFQVYQVPWHYRFRCTRCPGTVGDLMLFRRI